MKVIGVKISTIEKAITVGVGITAFIGTHLVANSLGSLCAKHFRNEVDSTVEDAKALFKGGIPKRSKSSSNKGKKEVTRDDILKDTLDDDDDEE